MDIGLRPTLSGPHVSDEVNVSQVRVKEVISILCLWLNSSKAS